jgi:hypothetical protein
MEYVLVCAKLDNGTNRNFIWAIPDGLTAETVAVNSGLDIVSWSKIDTDLFGSASVYYPDAFAFVDGVLDFNFDFAVATARWEVKGNNRHLASLRFKDFSADYIAAQALLPTELRDPDVQGLADEVAEIAATGEARALDLNSASTIDEVHAIVLESRAKVADYLPQVAALSA